jgi:hypothetical protein
MLYNRIVYYLTVTVSRWNGVLWEISPAKGILVPLCELGGIIIGGTTTHYTDLTYLTYVTPINEVFQDIEQRLGYAIRLPEVDDS